MSRLYSVVMAGGSGERFWPVSTTSRPKQFLSFTGDGKPLLQTAFDRAAALSGEDRVCLSTLGHLAQSSLEVCPGFHPDRVFVEPMKRNTAGALIWTAASLMSREEDWDGVSMAVLTADQLISPLEDFLATARDALAIAASTGGLVTIGIVPTRPETGFGYIQVGEAVGPGRRVARFMEKPNLEAAQEFFSSGRFLWNSGMFFWTLSGFSRELLLAQPEMHEVLMEVASALRESRIQDAETAFGRLPSLPIDIALMEKSNQVYVAPARFNWDDLGSWDSLARTLGSDEYGNTVRGPARLIDAKGCIVQSDGPEVCLLGVQGLTVVVHDGKIMVIPTHRAQDVKKFIKPTGG
jgi:mannose-1-phosphate guanylyltransferase